MQIQFIIASLAMYSALMGGGAAVAAAQGPALRIVVIAGEDAVNIIQQKTAVSPVVEVRDRNDLPVTGAIVTFNISGRAASFGGTAQTLTVTTNAAGRAAASALTPLGSGPVQIQVTAAFEGQTASAVISQTNFTTAAQAAAQTQAQAGGSNSSATRAGGSGGGNGSGSSVGALAGLAGGLAIAAAGAVVTSRENIASSSTSRAAALTVFAVENPVAFSGRVAQGGLCGGRSDTWFHSFRVEEFAGVAAVVRGYLFNLDGQSFPDQGYTREISANSSQSLGFVSCASATSSHFVQITFFGTDANGHEFTLESPVLTLLPRASQATELERFRTQISLPAGGSYPQ